MKKLYHFFLFTMLLMISQAGPAQTWEPIGPQGANIVNIQSTSTSLFAAGYIANNPSGIWRSGNNGETWENLTSLFPNKKIRNMWTCQDSILVSVSPRNVGGNPQPDGGVFLSTSNGQTWTTLFPNSGFNEPEAFLKKGGYMYFGGLTGISISNDLGLTWTTSTGGVSGQSYQVKCFETIGDTIFIGTRKGLFRSLNNCVTWTAASAGIPTTPVGANWITSMTKIGGTLYATSSIKGVYKSTNLGVSWVAVNNGITDLKANSIYYNGTALFAGTYYAGIYKSTDGGDSWAVATQGLINESVNCFLQHGNKLYVGGQAGVFASSNNGDSWTEGNDGLIGQIIGTGRSTPTNLIEAGGYLFAGSYQGRIFRSADNGGHWQPVGGEIRVGTLGFFNALAGNDSVVLVSAYDNKLYKSVDSGLTWTTTVFLENICPEKMLALNNRIYAVYADLLYYTDDNALSWVLQPTIGGCSYIGTKGNDIFISGYGFSEFNNVYRMAEGDTVFTYMGEAGTEGLGIYAIGSLENTLYISVGNEGIFKSENNGVTWTPDGLSTNTIYGLTSGGNALFARNGFNMWVRNNITGSWININSDLPVDDQSFYSTALLVNNGKLFGAVSSRSLYTTDIAQFTFTPPATPGPVNGPASPCIGSSQMYSVPNVPYVTYAWQFPAGWVITAGGTTNSVTVTVGSTPGVVLVTPSNLWGPGPAQFFIVNPNNNVPAQPGVITGATNPLEGTTLNYSIVNDPGVSYIWTFPAGWVQTAGGTTNSVTVSVGAGSGNIQVTPSTPCGTGIPRTLAVVTGPANLTVSNIILADGQVNCYNATETITIAGGGNTFLVQSGGSATFIAGQAIYIMPGTTVEEGGYLLGTITTTGQYCGALPPGMMVAAATAEPQAVLQTPSFRIYPNPAVDVFTVESTGKTTGIIKVEIFSMNGLKLLGREFPAEMTQTISAASLRPGMYFVHVTTGGGMDTLKLIKL